MSAMAIIILIVILLVAAVGVVAALIFVRNKKLKEGVEEEIKEEKEAAMWTCSCGEVTVPETEAAHCGFCGGYHEPYYATEGDAPVSDTKYPDYSQGSLYGDVPPAGAPVAEPQALPREEMQEVTPSTEESASLNEETMVGMAGETGMEGAPETQPIDLTAEAQPAQQAPEQQATSGTVDMEVTATQQPGQQVVAQTVAPAVQGTPVTPQARPSEKTDAQAVPAAETEKEFSHIV